MRVEGLVFGGQVSVAMHVVDRLEKHNKFLNKKIELVNSIKY